MMKKVYAIPILAAVLGLVTTATMQQSAYAHTMAWRYGYEIGLENGKAGAVGVDSSLQHRYGRTFHRAISRSLGKPDKPRQSKQMRERI